MKHGLKFKVTLATSTPGLGCQCTYRAIGVIDIKSVIIVVTMVTDLIQGLYHPPVLITCSYLIQDLPGHNISHLYCLSLCYIYKYQETSRNNINTNIL